MRTISQRLSQYLAAAKALPILVAVVAALAISAPEHRLTPRCGLLAGSVLGTTGQAGEACMEDLLALGFQCANSINEEAERAAGLLRDLLRGGHALPDWRFVGPLGAGRDATLIHILTELERNRQRDGDGLMAAEVGVMSARNSVALLDRFPNLRMLLVDPYHAIDSGASKVLTAHEWGFVTSPDGPIQRTQPFRSRATHVLQASVEAAAWVGRGTLDLVFIDGDHSYEAVREDIEAWWPTLRAGGVLAGHDYTLNYFGVIRAANEFALSHGLRMSLAPEVFWFFKP